ncbi:hypothetical protein WNZ15_23110 [Roseibium sp. AS2]|uniref:hypothetical protein n=1 Tax=Roseibium sp. AS2 TaxID=3135781 RepID=UPI00317958D4
MFTLKTAIFVAGAFFIALPVQHAPAANSDYCSKLLDRLVMDKKYEYRESSQTATSKEHMCEQFRKIEDDDTSLEAWANGYGGFNYDRSTFSDVMNNLCSSSESESSSKQKNIDFLLTLNPQIGGAVKSCASSHEFFNIKDVIFQKSDNDRTITIDVQFPRDLTLEGLNGLGFSQCRGIGAPLKGPIKISSGPKSLKVYCTRTYISSGPIMFPEACALLNTDKGALNLTAICLPAIKRPSLEYRWVQTKHKRTGTPFNITSNCTAVGSDSMGCHAGNLHKMASVPSNPELLPQGFGIGTPHWKAGNLNVSPDKKNLSISARFQCDGGNQDTTIPADTYMCVQALVFQK